MRKTGINLGTYGYEYAIEDVMRCIRDAGFDTFITGFTEDEKRTAHLLEVGEKLGLCFESLHAPYAGINCIWDAGEAGDAYAARLKRVVDTCKKFGIGYFTMHCMNVPQFNRNIKGAQKWSALGVERFRAVLDHADGCGVKACFENVEFPQFELKSLIDMFRTEGHPSLGFTWDTGHEHCYPGGLDIAEAFGDLLVGTHIHDNFGQTDPDVITWNDDCHILPFDGTVNFKKIGQALKSCGYTGSVTLEIGRNNAIPWYRDLSIEEFLHMAHERTLHIASWCEE